MKGYFMQSHFSVRNVYGDHMVFQRGQPISIVGTAPVRSTVVVRFAGKSLSVAADETAVWKAVFPAMQAGGPYELGVSCQAGATVTFRDILIGEVWFCSGQSNMEFPVCGDNYFFALRDGKDVAANAHDDKLRLFHTQHAVSPDGPCEEAPAGCAWKTATSPGAVGQFSAIGYWFGVFLRKTLGDVPVGMIHSSWGGTLIEPWISKEAFVEAGRAQEILQMESAQRLCGQTSDEAQEEYRQKVLSGFESWLKQYFGTDPATTAEALANWAKPATDVSSWKHGVLASLTAAKAVGVSWFRHEVAIPAEWAGRDVVLHFDAVNDCDETFFDGRKIGATSYEAPNYWCAPRDYPVPAKLAAPGRHVVAVRVINHFMQGGIIGKAWLGSNGDTDRIYLHEGIWAERLEFAADIRKIGVRPMVPCGMTGLRESQQTPTTLYNAMVHPFTVLNVRGFLWYQGCSNTGNAKDYRILQPLLIDCWRKAWGNPEAAFILTQLSAFQQHTPDNRLADDFWKALQPDDSGYAQLRDVQASMRTYPNTGVAVTIDIGDHSDIHPHNKKDVAFRLEKEAERLCYGSTGITAGPYFKSMAVVGDKIRVSFTNVGRGLVVRGGSIGPHNFAIAGADGNYVWAEAKLDGETIVVWSPEVPKPANVRYAWSMFPPNPNLYNAEGFPMSPFRTDA